MYRDEQDTIQSVQSMNTLGGTLPLQEHNIHANQVNITLSGTRIMMR